MKRKIFLLFLGVLLVSQLSYMLFMHYNPPSPREVPNIHSSAGGMIEGHMNVHAFHPKVLNTVNGESMNLFMEDETVLPETSGTYEFQSNPFAEYLSMNQDFTGWITVEGTNIDHPVVRGRDNSYYLNHNFYHETDTYGAIFMDYRNLGNGHDDHTIIYGHHTDTGHMFADFEKYLSRSFFEENKTVEIQDLYKKRDYEIISVHVGPADLDYINEPFQNSDTEAYGEFLKGQSLYDSDMEIEEDAKLLTLISCNYSYDDGRLYVHAVEIPD
ncbi:class B sortase [Lacicoccus alkaliphilus]|uniref:Sortase family protein n=1 Tax=Lacicoccus alkaliphilus DSM 16010 TaxID=1123231 RepID=A0A1M7GM88_9BACL|nr:class B sortase [Salinicoccus alkaliphilus]SHM17403.1 Sortase family protein [Salinicoccus alkaliphilus DSM 16010]